MVEIVGEHGYGAVTVRQLAQLAGVSTRAFYEHFDSKEDCFLQTFDLVVQRAGGRIVLAQHEEQDWRKQLRLAFCAFAHELVDKPRVGRLALIEALAAGPASLEQMRRTETMFERMIEQSFSRAPDGVNVPAILIEGIVAGVSCVARERLLADREAELPGLADELTEWALSYRDPAADAVVRLSPLAPDQGGDGERRRARRRSQNKCAPGDQRALILSAAARLAARDGYPQLTVPHIRSAAGVSRKTFDAHFEGVTDCFLAALEQRVGITLAQASRAHAEARTWAGGIHRAMGALCAQIAKDPVLAQIAFLEVFTPGPSGLRCRQRLMSSTASLLRDGAPPEHRPGALAAEASVGAIWGVLHHQIASGRARQLPRIAPVLSFLTLAPAIGAAAAEEAICHERSELYAASPVAKAS